MAKAKVGGTSAKLRGVVGDYIYQVVRNPAGYSEQKVITYTREKLNRNTKYQCLARMQITMFMNCMKLLTPIICDSFEGLRSRVNSCNRFVQINMPLVQDYCVQHWTEGIGCSWPIKSNLNETYFNFWISEGSYKIPQRFSCRVVNDYRQWPRFDFNLYGTGCRKIDLRKMLGFNKDDSLNVLYWLTFGRSVMVMNVQLNPLFNDYTVISEFNITRLFKISLNVLRNKDNTNYEIFPETTFDNNTKVVSLMIGSYFRSEYGRYGAQPDFYTYIFSRRKGNVWQRSTNRFHVCRVDGEDVDFGDPPMSAYYYWDENYNGEEYQEYFK